MRLPEWWYESLRRRDALWESIERARVDDELEARTQPPPGAGPSPARLWVGVVLGLAVVTAGGWARLLLG